MAKIIRSITSVLFGSWPHADGTVNPIEWELLKQDGNKALLISKNGLTQRRFDEDSNVWADSEIRHWLNNEFLNAAFTEADKTAILETELPDVGTTDKVFLLSCEEAETLFKCDEERRLGKMWWLRSPGFHGFLAAFVYGEYGGVRAAGFYVEGVFGVRPALWMNLDSDIFKS